MFTEDKRYFSSDTLEAELDVPDSLDTEDFSMDEENVVKVNQAPWAEAFDTDKFFKIPATVARPIEQTYVVDGKKYTFKKPAEELKRSAWSLENKPLTLGHPSAKTVKAVDEIHGFWKGPEYSEDTDDLDAMAYIPVNDEEALEYADENDNVSVGFSHGLERADEEGVDGYQTDIYYDHVAVVEHGRCSDEDGCGLGGRNMTEADSQGMTEYSISPDQASDATNYVNPDDDKWYAVPPGDNPDDEWKFPINNCSDVQDAWQLRSHGDISIEVSTLESRIKNRASDLGCEVPGDSSTDSSDMTEKDCDCGEGEDQSFDEFVSALSVDAVAQRNDEIEQLMEEKEEYEEQVDELQEDKEELETQVDELEEELEEFRDAELDELREEIMEITDYWDEEELAEVDDEAELEEKLELAAEFSADEGTVNPDGGEVEEEGITPMRDSYDLSSEGRDVEKFASQ